MSRKANVTSRRICAAQTRPVAGRRRTRPAARGAVAVESLVVLVVMLILLLGVLDVGRATYTYVTLSESARRIARQAIVHGELAAGKLGSWGPNMYQGTANDGSEIAAVIAPLLPLLDDANVRLRVEWLDGDNHADSRVRVSVVQPFTPIVPGLLGVPSCDLAATSTMRIHH